jgi:hypothetical protein
MFRETYNVALLRKLNNNRMEEEGGEVGVCVV